jgi:plasmid stabilization system protein ParE
MRDYALTPSAEADLETIWSYIADDDSVAADGLEADIHAACQLLADQPAMGVKRPQWTKLALRFWFVRSNYLIVYNPDSDPLQIQRILHAARDIPKLL